MSSRTARGLRRAAPLAAALMLAAPALAQSALNTVRVEGAQRIAPETVASYVAIERGGRITDEALNQSVRNLFETGLFADAQVIRQGGTILVRVVENPTINRILFEGNDDLDDDQLIPLLSNAPRRVLTEARVQSDIVAMTELYRRTGRYGATITPERRELPDNRVDLVFNIEEGDVTNVEQITFEGNEVYSDRRLRGVIETSESGVFGFLISTDTYDPDRLEFDKELLRNYYLEHGYADFAVESAEAALLPDRSGFALTFRVYEGQRYAFGPQNVIAAAPDLDPEEFSALIAPVEGETYDVTEVEKTIDAMTYLAGQKGYAFIRVLPRAIRNPGAQTIGIDYELAEGPRVFVERIEIEGNSRTLDRVIRRQFALAEGDAYNARALEEARRKIRALNYFSDVKVITEQGATPDRAVIRVQLEEKSTGAFEIGAGYSTSDGVLFNARLTERNFLGRGQRLSLIGTVGADKQVYSFSFREPAFLDRDLGVGFNLYYREFDRSDSSSFEERNIGFEPSVDFPVSQNGRLSLRYRLSEDLIRNVNPNASGFIKRDKGAAFTSSVGYTYVYDRRNDKLEPTEGYLLSFSQDFAGLGGDARYIATNALGRVSTAFFDEQVVASLEVEGAAIFTLGDDLRVTDRYFLGGDTFRGFRSQGVGPRDMTTDDALGGNYFAIARAQVTFPIGLPEEWGIYGGVFGDIGAVWGLDTDRVGGVTVDDGAHLRAAIGVSLFWDTGFGPLRLNFAYPLMKEDGDEAEYFRVTASTRF